MLTEPAELPAPEEVTELTAERVKALLPNRPQNSSKATFGNVLNISGSVSYRGAAYLSSVSALRVGAGYVTLACIEPVASSIAALVPDIVIFPLRSRYGAIAGGEYRAIAKILHKYRVLLVGCGLSGPMGIDRNLKVFFRGLLGTVPVREDSVRATIIDADGLNVLSEFTKIKLPPHTVLTPHPKELSRLLKITTEEIQANRVPSAEFAARKFGATVVLKGHRTVVTDGKNTFINVTGNSGLAKAGTGDVLAGMIAGLCAQGLSTLNASCLAAYLHGKAGEFASADKTEYGVLASDLQSYIPLALKLCYGSCTGSPSFKNS